MAARQPQPARLTPCWNTRHANNSKRLRPAHRQTQTEMLWPGDLPPSASCAGHLSGLATIRCPHRNDAARPLANSSRAEIPLALPEPAPLPTPVQRFRRCKACASQTSCMKRGRASQDQIVSRESSRRPLPKLPLLDYTDPSIHRISKDKIVEANARFLQMQADARQRNIRKQAPPPSRPNCRQTPANPPASTTVKQLNKPRNIAAETRQQPANGRDRARRNRRCPTGRPGCWNNTKHFLVCNYWARGMKNRLPIIFDAINSASIKRLLPGSLSWRDWYVLMYGIYPTERRHWTHAHAARSSPQSQAMAT